MEYNFLIESDHNGIPLHDFGFHMIEACRYKNWFNDNEDYQYYLTDNIFEYDFTNYIPIGSVKFVHKFLKEYHDISEPRPINIPNELYYYGYLKRLLFRNINKNDITNFEGIRFVKSEDKVKKFTEIMQMKDIDTIPNGNYLFSELIDIESEWRCFIYNKKLVGLQNYSGDFTMFPDIKLINDMINNYKDCPPAYTLDIGINENNGTFIIEVHNFYSCGLYGFTDYRILPDMFEKSFKWIVK
jgi:hypothetical protein